MTSYATIADSDIDPESPGTTQLFTRLRDNPLAIQENDATAPDVVGASWVKISEQTASSSSEIAFTGLDNTYASYYVVGENIRPATSAAILYSQISDDNGSTYKSGTDYDKSGWYQELGTETLDGAADQQFMIACSAGNGQNTNRGSAFFAWMWEIGDSSYPRFAFEGHGITPSNANPTLSRYSYIYDNLITVNAVRFYYSSGNIASGTFKLYGLRAV